MKFALALLSFAFLSNLSTRASAQPEQGAPPPPPAAAPEATPPPAEPPPPAAVAPPAPAPAPAPKDDMVPVVGKWSPQLYGFVQLNAFYDTTQSYTEQEGNGLVARSGTYAGDHERFMMSARHSRVGFKLASPEYAGVKASGQVELDFLGNQPPTVSEAAFFNNPAIRIRHFVMKLQSPYVDIWAGQTWHLFGLQPYFDPNSVEIQGTPAQVYGRTAQLRLSHTFKTSPVDIEIAAAALRPPQRNAGVPDAAGALKLSVNGWKGVHTTGAAGTSVDAAAIGVSGVYRTFELPELSPTPMNRLSTTGKGVSIDAFLPVIPAASVKDRSNALSLTGSFVTGEGIADLYSGFTGGVSFPAPPNPMMTSPAPTYTADVDAGLVTFDADGNPKAVKWQTFMAGLQYYLPPSGKVFVSGVYGQADSDNIAALGTPAKVIKRIQWISANIFWDALPSVRLGAAFDITKQRYGDDVDATNDRFQFIALYIF